jgi:hypothetical protein
VSQSSRPSASSVITDEYFTERTGEGEAAQRCSELCVHVSSRNGLGIRWKLIIQDKWATKMIALRSIVYISRGGMVSNKVELAAVAVTILALSAATAGRPNRTACALLVLSLNYFNDPGNF